MTEPNTSGSASKTLTTRSPGPIRITRRFMSLPIKVGKVLLTDTLRLTVKALGYWPDVLWLSTVGLTIIGAFWWFTFPWKSYPNRQSPRAAFYEWLKEKGMFGDHVVKKYFASVLERARK